jgi:signal peptidase I
MPRSPVDLDEYTQPAEAGSPEAPAPVGRPATTPDADDSENLSFGRWLLELVVLVGLAFILATGIKTFVVQPFVIPSGSMESTIQISDRVLVNKFIYRFHPPRRGDIVVFEPWTAGEPDLIKRIIGVGGETVDYVGGQITIDGVPIVEPYVSAANRRLADVGNLPFKVPEGDIFVMGDNRNNSGDSRFRGPVPLKRVLGQAFVIYWPISRIRALH